MANEKMKILQMLEEGKITSGEAARLLQSLDGDKGGYKREDTRETYSEPSSNRPRTSSAGSGESLDDFAADLGKKFESFARDMQPKIQKLTEVVVEKTADMADKLSKTLTVESTPRTPHAPAASAPTVTSAGKQGLVKNFETLVTPGYNELNLSSLNGDLVVKGYNGDKITAKIFYRPRKGGAKIEIMKLGNKYYLNYEEDDFEFVNIDAFVPDKMFNVINLSCINGSLDVSSLTADNVFVSNLSGKTEVKRIQAGSLKIENNNGTLLLSEITAEKGLAENFNGTTEGYAIDIKNLKLTGFNGGMGLNIGSFNNYSDYVWVVEASNGKMSLNLPTLPDLAYYIKAHASFGSIKIGLTGLNYTANDNSYAEAKSINYDRASKSVRLSLDTSNGSLVIN